MVPAGAGHRASGSPCPPGIPRAGVPPAGPSDPSSGRRHAPEERPLERAHRGLLGRLRVVPAAEVERAMDDEEAQLVGRRPAHVARLAAASLPGLGDRPLDGDDDVAEVEPRAGRQQEGPVGAPASLAGRSKGARMRRERLRRQEREGEDVGRAVLAHVGGVQAGQLGVVGQEQAHRGRLRRPAGEQRGAHGPARAAAGTSRGTPGRTSRSTRNGGR